MSERLQNLRDQMMREKEVRDASSTQKVGGTKWRSARTDKSVRNYAKDVKDKYQQKVDAARQIPSNTSSSRRTSKASEQQQQQRPGLPPVTFPPHAPLGKGGGAVAALAIGVSDGGGAGGGGGGGRSVKTVTVDAWDVSDVVAWLSDMGLAEQYKDSFERNEINGPTLLEVGLDDLDYMEIRVLAHRKLLLKGIEDLKKNGRPTLQLRASPTKPKQAASGRAETSSQSSQSSSVQPPKSAAAAVVHWSNAKPISENKVDPGNDMAANLADGEYDEAAQTREFQAAVAAWRTGGDVAPSSSSSGSQSGGASESEAAEFGYGSGSTPSSGGGGALWNNPSFSSGDGEEAKAMPAGSSSGGGSSSSLLDGEYDEAAVAKEFQDAVLAWRTGGDSAPAITTTQGSSSTSTEIRPDSSSSSGSGVGMGGQVSRVLVTAAAATPLTATTSSRKEKSARWNDRDAVSPGSPGGVIQVAGFGSGGSGDSGEESESESGQGKERKKKGGGSRWSAGASPEDVLVDNALRALKQTTVVPGFMRWLDQMRSKGVPVAIVSTYPRATVQACLEAAGVWGELFHGEEGSPPLFFPADGGASADGAPREEKGHTPFGGDDTFADFSSQGGSSQGGSSSGWAELRMRPVDLVCGESVGHLEKGYSSATAIQAQLYLKASLRVERAPCRVAVFDASPQSMFAAHEADMRGCAVLGTGAQHKASFRPYDFGVADLTCHSLDELSFGNLRGLFSDRTDPWEVETELELLTEPIKRKKTMTRVAELNVDGDKGGGGKAPPRKTKRANT
mmetsp:Transcript_47391/g.80848  ORF Transcript_47391/g.80848 Transcript_47391/m.80848 type:complete len:789 (+) Transcript_47391:161-2527(+)